MRGAAGRVRGFPLNQHHTAAPAAHADLWGAGWGGGVAALADCWQARPCRGRRLPHLKHHAALEAQIRAPPLQPTTLSPPTSQPPPRAHLLSGEAGHQHKELVAGGRLHGAVGPEVVPAHRRTAGPGSLSSGPCVAQPGALSQPGASWAEPTCLQCPQPLGLTRHTQHPAKPTSTAPSPLGHQVVWQALDGRRQRRRGGVAPQAGGRRAGRQRRQAQGGGMRGGQRAGGGVAAV